MKLGANEQVKSRSRRFHRLARPRYRAWHWRPAEGPRHRDLRAGISGKTTLALQTIAEAQKKRRHLRLRRCRACARSGLCPQAGRGCRELLISQPDTGEQALEIADTLVRSGAVMCW
jgi:hypothetical protein